VDTAEGWLYVALVMDLFSGRLVGWAMGDRIDTRLTTEALGLALGLRDPPAGLLRHSDRGSQYCAHDHRDALEDGGVTVSMSQRANCYDNPPMESNSPVRFERRWTMHQQQTRPGGTASYPPPRAWRAREAPHARARG
jgi:putative transposase